MERIGADVERELSRFGMPAALGELLRAWPAAVGEQIARNASPARIQRDGTLVVHTSSSAWAFELAQLESVIRERLAELAPQRLRFVPGPLAEPPEPPPSQATAARVETSVEDLERGREVAAPIADEKLRKLVARAAAKSLANTRNDRSF